MDELNALPYLDMMVRETMRIHAPVPSTIRVAMKDDILPLNAPFKDKKGVLHDGIRYSIPSGHRTASYSRTLVLVA
jgi:hypothetical protein